VNIDKIISALPGMSHLERERVRENAERLRDYGSAEQKAAAARLIETLGEQEGAEHHELAERLSGMELGRRRGLNERRL
jgi:hypothetical protein